MDVQIDQAWGDIETGSINYCACLASRDRSFYRRDTIVLDSYIEYAIPPILGIDDMTAFD